HDVVAAAADDHLNLIATGDPSPSPPTSSCAGVHVWDYEVCALLGTCLLPSIPLTRATNDAAAAFGSSVSDCTGRGAGKALVTSLEFLAPRPVLVGATTGGAVVLWSVPECVCVQAR
ncbi:unnamed protein product, partial [Discosporangium mesarthrocarpum]